MYNVTAHLEALCSWVQKLSAEVENGCTSREVFFVAVLATPVSHRWMKVRLVVLSSVLRTGELLKRSLPAVSQFGRVAVFYHPCWCLLPQNVPLPLLPAMRPPSLSPPPPHSPPIYSSPNWLCTSRPITFCPHPSPPSPIPPQTHCVPLDLSHFTPHPASFFPKLTVSL